MNYCRRWQALLLFFISVCISVFVACTHNTDTVETVPTRSVRLVKHALGETQVPTNPQRIVTLDSYTLEAVLALNTKPIGAARTDWEHLRDRLDGVTNIGLSGEPSLEKVLTLKPDLILGNSYQQSVYNPLSQIAPTVIAKFENSGDWKAIFTLVGQALGTNTSPVMERYYARLEDFKTRMGDRLNWFEVSVITVPPAGGFYIYGSDTFSGTILADAGLRRPAAQQNAAITSLRLSRERLSNADGDVIFLWNYSSPDEQVAQIQATAKLKADPLWQQLNAVKQGKVYEVPHYWIGTGAIAANLVIDDLFTYLLALKK